MDSSREEVLHSGFDYYLNKLALKKYESSVQRRVKNVQVSTL